MSFDVERQEFIQIIHDAEISATLKTIHVPWYNFEPRYSFGTFTHVSEWYQFLHVVHSIQSEFVNL